jgi:methionyl-tRNA formyltransferase
MTKIPKWWEKPRRVCVVIDNPSWILPHGQKLVEQLQTQGDTVRLCRSHEEINKGEVAFYLGCVKITPPDILARNRRNLAVHESALPKGRGFSPLTWQILEGKNTIPVCLLEAVQDVDAGPVIYRDELLFEGHELIDEMRDALGDMTVSQCLRFMSEPSPPPGHPQSGEPTHYDRRNPEDSRLDTDKTLGEQFNLLRVVDNEKYPAFFKHGGKRYKFTIKKVK